MEKLKTYKGALQFSRILDGFMCIREYNKGSEIRKQSLIVIYLCIAYNPRGWFLILPPLLYPNGKILHITNIIIHFNEWIKCGFCRNLFSTYVSEAPKDNLREPTPSQSFIKTISKKYFSRD